MVVPLERPLHPRASRDGLRLGARVDWQPVHPLAALLAHTATKQIVVSSRPQRMAWSSELLWIVVPEVAWTSVEPLYMSRSLVKLPYPSGAADNRHARRKRERKRIDQMEQDRALFSQVICWTDLTTFSGHYVARPEPTGVSLAVIP
jgi:hypothetical protein